VSEQECEQKIYLLVRFAEDFLLRGAEVFCKSLADSIHIPRTPTTKPRETSIFPNGAQHLRRILCNNFRQRHTHVPATFHVIYRNRNTDS